MECGTPSPSVKIHDGLISHLVGLQFEPKRVQVVIRFVLFCMSIGMSACTSDRENSKAEQAYSLMAVHSRKCLDVEAGSVSDRARVLQWDCSNSPHQLWRLIGDPRGGVTIVAQHSGKCLDSASAGFAAKGLIRQSSCSNHVDSRPQRWVMRGSEHEGYQIVALGTGKCLDVEGGRTGNGARVLQYECSNAGRNQRWLLYPAPAAVSSAATEAPSAIAPGERRFAGDPYGSDQEVRVEGTERNRGAQDDGGQAGDDGSGDDGSGGGQGGGGDRPS
jgi:hypothetical protein